MNNESAIRSYITLHNKLATFVEVYDSNRDESKTMFPDYFETLALARIKNAWFTELNCLQAIKGIVAMLEQKKFMAWINHYGLFNKNCEPKTIGLIMAGNIPLVGFHDLMSVLITGHKACIKLSSDDNVLMPFIINELTTAEPDLKEQINIVDRITSADAYIATGSNNSARYFEYYFGKQPNLIRRNMNSVAILTGYETTEELYQLGKDIFTYFGLGCRSVSKIYVPENYSFDNFFEAILPFKFVMEHNKYMNNFDYHNALFLLNKEHFLTNNFLIVRENKILSTPVAVLHYEYYDDIKSLLQQLSAKDEAGLCDMDHIQGMVSGSDAVPEAIPFGSSQWPAVDAYADRIDTIAFLINLN